MMDYARNKPKTESGDQFHQYKESTSLKSKDKSFKPLPTVLLFFVPISQFLEIYTCVTYS